MELTLNIPEHLIFRLRSHEDQMAEILELGLDALEAADRIATAPMDSDGVPETLPLPWQEATDALAQSVRADSTTSRPSQAELAEYLRGDLDGPAADALRQRLLEHPESLDRLLAMDDSRTAAEGSSTDRRSEQISDDEVQQAWRHLQLRIKARPEGPTPLPSEDLPFEVPAVSPPRKSATPPSPSLPRAERARPRRSAAGFRQRPWLAAAASLLLTTGGFAASSLYHSHYGSAPQITEPIQLNASRGSRSYTVAPDAEHILLLVPRPPSTRTASQRLVLEVTSPRGHVVFRRSIQGLDGGGEMLHLVVPREDLTAGDHHLRILDPAAPSQNPLEDFPFTLVIR